MRRRIIRGYASCMALEARMIVAVLPAYLWGCEDVGEDANCDDLTGVAVAEDLASGGTKHVPVPGRGVWIRELLIFVDEASREETLHYFVLGTLADEAGASWEAKKAPLAVDLGESWLTFALMDMRDDGNDEDNMDVEPVDGRIEVLTPGGYGWQAGGQISPVGETVTVQASSGVLTLDNQGDRVTFNASHIVFESNGGFESMELDGDGVFCAYDFERTIDPPDTVE